MVEYAVVSVPISVADSAIGQGLAVGVGDLGQVDGVGVDALVVEHGSVDGEWPAVDDGAAVHVGVGAVAAVDIAAGVVIARAVVTAVAAPSPNVLLER